MLSEYFTKRFGLTIDGANNLIKGILYTALLNIQSAQPVRARGEDSAEFRRKGGRKAAAIRSGDRKTVQHQAC